MGSNVNIGLRGSAGEIMVARSYSHVMPRIANEIDFTSGFEDGIRSLVGEYHRDPTYGPTDLIPAEGGILYFDFVEKRVLNGQWIAHFPGMPRSAILHRLANNPSSLERLAPCFRSMMVTRIAEDGTIHSDERQFERATTLEELWSNAGISSRSIHVGGRIRTVPASVSDFDVLMFDIPDWEIASPINRGWKAVARLSQEHVDERP